MSLSDPIVQAVSKYMSVGDFNPSNYNVSFRCPFHSGGRESSPSFYMYIGPCENGKVTGMSFCHACDRGWTFQSLLRDLKVDPAERRALVEHYIPEDRSVPTDKKIALVNFRLPEHFVEFFRYKPKALAGTYSDETLKRYEIGYDIRRARIIFPLRMHDGSLVGFSGRNEAAQTYGGKYKIYKEELREYYPKYDIDKSKLLWGLDKFYPDAMMGGMPSDAPVALCEGFKAGMWVYQCGFRYVVVSLGTHLSQEQLFLLQRITNKVVLFYDNNKAGRRGTVNAIRALTANSGLDFAIARYPIGTSAEQPDGLREEEVIAALTNPINRIEWKRSMITYASV